MADDKPKGLKHYLIMGTIGLICFAGVTVAMLYFTGTWHVLFGDKEDEASNFVLEVVVVKEELEKIEVLFEELGKEEERLKDKEKELDERESHLLRIEERLQKQREEMQSLKNKISQFITEINEGEMKNVKRLAKIYGSMKSQEVIPIMDVLSDEMLVMILSSMKEKSAAKVLGAYALRDQSVDGLEQPYSERAARLTERLRRFKAQVKAA